MSHPAQTKKPLPLVSKPLVSKQSPHLLTEGPQAAVPVKHWWPDLQGPTSCDAINVKCLKQVSPQCPRQTGGGQGLGEG